MHPPFSLRQRKNSPQRSIKSLRRVKSYPRYHSNCTPRGSTTHQAPTSPRPLTQPLRGRVYCRKPGSSFQLRSYKPLSFPWWLAPAATSLKGSQQGPLRHRLFPLLNYGTDFIISHAGGQEKIFAVFAAGRHSSCVFRGLHPAALPPRPWAAAHASQSSARHSGRNPFQSFFPGHAPGKNPLTRAPWACMPMHKMVRSGTCARAGHRCPRPQSAKAAFAVQRRGGLSRELCCGAAPAYLRGTASPLEGL